MHVALPRLAVRPRLLTAALLIAIACPAVTASAQPATDGPIERLKPGQFLWAPELAPEGPVTIIVSLSVQRAYAYRNGVPIGVSTISTGRKGHETPTGVFTILQKKADHRSNLYDDAPMPFMQRLTWDGIALHAGDLPGHPASHGCIRLPLDFARKLFAITQLGLTVVVTDERTVPEIAPQAAVPMALPVAGADDPDRYEWTPEVAPTGPVSIVVSGRDRRVVVLRNGKRIGSAPLRLETPITQTVAFTLRAVDQAGAHWLRLPLPGQKAGDATEMTEAERASGHVPAGFRAALQAVLRPGATLLVTRDTLATSGTGTKIGLLAVGQPARPRR